MAAAQGADARVALLNALLEFKTIGNVNASHVLESLDSNIGAVADGVGQMWVLVCSLLVFFMQAGFGMLESGSVQEKNMKSILFKNVLDFCVSGFVFFVFSYGLAFGHNSTTAPVFGWDTPFRLLTEEPQQGYSYVFFMSTFASTCATIVSGAVAERISFAAYLWIVFLLSVLVEPTVMHWVWSPQGWLAGSNPHSAGGLFVIDFAGAGVVHLVGGVAAFQAARAVGPRMRPARFDSDTGVREIPGSNASLTVLGTLIMWFSWFGFTSGGAFFVNARPEYGSETSVNCIDTKYANLCHFLLGFKSSRYKMASQALMNTAIAPMMSCITAVLVGWVVSGIISQWKQYSLPRSTLPRPFSSGSNFFLFLKGVLKKGKLDLSYMTNGILIGTVSMTGGSVLLTTGTAAICGCIAGFFYVFCDLVLIALRIDDPVNASVVHAGGGALGLLFCAFSNPAFVRRTYNRDYLGLGWHFLCQLIGIAVISAWSGLITYLLFGLMAKILRTDPAVRVNILRIPLDKEEWGSDIDLNWGIRKVKLRPSLADYLSRVRSEKLAGSPFNEMNIDSFLNLPTSKALTRVIVDRYRSQYLRQQEAMENSSDSSIEEFVSQPVAADYHEDVLSGSGDDEAMNDETVSYSMSDV